MELVKVRRLSRGQEMLRIDMTGLIGNDCALKNLINVLMLVTRCVTAIHDVSMRGYILDTNNFSFFLCFFDCLNLLLILLTFPYLPEPRSEPLILLLFIILIHVEHRMLAQYSPNLLFLRHHDQLLLLNGRLSL